MAHPSEIAATIVVLVVAAITLFLTVVAGMAANRTGNRKLWYLGGAFGLFAIKSALTAWALQTGGIGHEHLELVLSGFDLGIVILLVIPLIR